MKTILRRLAGLFPHPHVKRDRFAAERDVVWQAYRAAMKSKDTRRINQASALMQAATHCQLADELGRKWGAR